MTRLLFCHLIQMTNNGQHILDVSGLHITDPLAFETQVSQWPGVVMVGVFAHQKSHVCLLGTENGVKTLVFLSARLCNSTTQISRSDLVVGPQLARLALNRQCAGFKHIATVSD